METRETIANSLAQRAEQTQIRYKNDMIRQATIILIDLRIGGRKYAFMLPVGKNVLEDMRQAVEGYALQKARFNLADTILSNPNVTKPKGRLPN